MCIIFHINCDQIERFKLAVSSRFDYKSKAMVSHLPSLLNDNSRRYGILFLVFCSIFLTTSSLAQIQVADIGSNPGVGVPPSTPTSIKVNVPAAGVTLGKTIFVTVAMDPSSASVSVIDTRGNTYTTDADVTNVGAAGTDGVRTLIFSEPVTTALVSGRNQPILIGICFMCNDQYGQSTILHLQVMAADSLIPQMVHRFLRWQVLSGTNGKGIRDRLENSINDVGFYSGAKIKLPTKKSLGKLIYTNLVL